MESRSKPPHRHLCCLIGRRAEVKLEMQLCKIYTTVLLQMSCVVLLLETKSEYCQLLHKGFCHGVIIGQDLIIIQSHFIIFFLCYTVDRVTFWKY